jgi:hypothetical protein
MIQGVRIIVRAIGIAWGYAITLGCLYGARLFWLVQASDSEPHTSRFRAAVEAALRTSPFIVLAGSMFTLIAIPLAAWSIGSGSWGSLKRYIYGFWLVLALFIVVSGNPSGLILISGAGGIALWFLRNRLISEESSQMHMYLRREGSRSNIAIFAILAVITCSLSLFLFFGSGTKIYTSEIFAVYAIACICQGFKTFPIIEHGQNESHEAKP